MKITICWDSSEIIQKYKKIGSVEEMKQILSENGLTSNEIENAFINNNYIGGRRHLTVIHRFFNKIQIEPTNNCWIWFGSIGGDLRKTSYGRLFYNSKNVMAHRFSYEFFNKKVIQVGNEIDHICRNSLCVNPKHLQEITALENTMRNNNPMSINARKTHCIRGHKLSGKNLYTAKNGTRKCITCIKFRAREYRERKNLRISFIV